MWKSDRFLYEFPVIIMILGGTGKGKRRNWDAKFGPNPEMFVDIDIINYADLHID